MNSGNRRERNVSRHINKSRQIPRLPVRERFAIFNNDLNLLWYIGGGVLIYYLIKGRGSV